MFDNIGTKVKTMASVFCGIGIVGSIILGITYISSNLILCVIIAVLGSFLSWLSSLALYAIGQSAENTDHILRKVKTIENMVSKSLRDTQPEDQNAIPTQPKTTSTQTKLYSNDSSEGSWWCSCGAANRDTESSCSVCYKPRPTKK